MGTSESGSARLGIAIVHGGLISYANDALLDILRYRREQLLQRPFQDLLVSQRKSSKGHGAGDYQTVMVAGDGTPQVVESFVSEVGQDLVACVRDVPNPTACRERLLGLIQLGVELLAEHREEAVLARVGEGLSALDLLTVQLVPAERMARVENLHLPSSIRKAPDLRWRGRTGQWLEPLQRAWEQGAVFVSDAPALAAQFLGGKRGALAGRGVGEAGLFRAFLIRADVAGGPQVLLALLGHWLSEDHLPQMRLFASQLSGALTAARSRGQLGQRIEELAALNRMANIAAAASDLQTFLQHGSEELTHQFGADGVTILGLDEAQRELVRLYQDGVGTERDRPSRISLDAGTPTARLLDRTTAQAVPPNELVDLERSGVARAGDRALFYASVISSGCAVGLLTLHYRTLRPANDRELRLLQRLGEPFAAALQSGRLKEKRPTPMAELHLLRNLGEYFAGAMGAAGPRANGESPATLHLSGLLEQVLEPVLQAVHADVAAAYVLETGDLKRAAHLGMSAELAVLCRLALTTEGPLRALVQGIDPVPFWTRQLPPGTRESAAREGIQVLVSVPVTFQRRQVGLLLLGRRLPRAFEEAELRQLSALGSQLGIAMENARLLAQTQRRISDVEALNRLTQRVFELRPGEVDTLMIAICEEAATALHALGAAVFLVDQDESLLVGTACWGVPRSELEAIRIPLDDATGGWAILKSEQPMVIENTAVDPRTRLRIRSDIPPRTVLGLPLARRGVPLGIIGVIDEVGRTFSPSEVELGSAMAAQSAVVIENAKLYSATRRQVEELSLLHEVGRSLVASLDPDQVLEVGVRNLARTMQVPVAYLMLANAEWTQLEIRAASANNPDLVGFKLPLEPMDSSIAAMAFHRQVPICIEDADTNRLVHAETRRRLGGRAYLGLPMVVRNRSIGMAMVVESRSPRHFGSHEIELALAVANQLAVAVENARLYDDLRKSYEQLHQAQQQLIQRERLAALGELAAAVAHEVRNPLGAIFNGLSALRRTEKSNPDAERVLEILVEEADRLNRIVGDLLDFARPTTPAMQPASLAQVVDEAVDAALDQVPRKLFQVTREHDADLPMVPMDARLMRQAVLNIASNALQAMAKGGKLLLRTQSVETPPGPMARLEIIDTGPGIDPELLPRIFEPFFTTKAAGTGLGLAVVKRIIESHRGSVEVDSRVGSGTVVVIKLPLEEPGT